MGSKILSIVSLLFVSSALVKAEATTKNQSTSVLVKAEAATENKPKPISVTERKKNDLKIRAAAFYPQGSLTRNIYGRFWPEGSLEYDYLCSRHFSLFLNGAYARKDGHSLGERHKTTITLLPMTIGANAWLGSSSWWHPYLGIGIGTVYAHIHNFSPYVKQSQSYWGFASLFQAGMEFDVTKCLFFDLFADYRFNWFEFNKDRSRAQTSGVDLGAGLGFRF